MNVLTHPIFPHVAPYFHVLSDGTRDNVDLIDLPDHLRELALGVVVNCASCAEVIHPFRVRAKSLRARTANSPDERRLFYSGTCAFVDNPGCCRTNSASDHKSELVRKLRER